MLSSHGLQKVRHSLSCGRHLCSGRDNPLVNSNTQCQSSFERLTSNLLCFRNARQQSYRLRVQSAAKSEQTEKKIPKQRRKPKGASSASASSPSGRRKPKKLDEEEGSSGEAGAEGTGRQPTSEEAAFSEEEAAAEEGDQDRAEQHFGGWTAGELLADHFLCPSDSSGCQSCPALPGSIAQLHSTYRRHHQRSLGPAVLQCYQRQQGTFTHARTGGMQMIICKPSSSSTLQRKF